MKRHPVAWFRVKRFGYGVDLPIAWQGWAVMLAHIAGAVLTALLLPGWSALAVLLVLTAVLLLVTCWRSDDEWRWRNGY